MKLRFLRLGRSKNREGESTISLNENLTPKHKSSSPITRGTTESDTRDELRDSAESVRRGDDHEHDEPLPRVGNEIKNNEFHQNLKGSMPYEDNVITPSFIASAMKEFATLDLDERCPPSLQSSAIEEQERAGIFGIFGNMVCLPTIGRGQDTEVVTSPVVGTDDADAVKEKEWRATRASSEGDEVHWWHFCGCFGEYHDEPSEEEAKQSVSTSANLLIARLIDVDHDCQRSIVRLIVEGYEGAILLIAPGMTVESLQGSAKEEQESTGIFGIFGNMVCLPTIGRENDTEEVVLTQIVATDDGDAVEENEGRAILASSEGDKPGNMIAVSGYDEVHQWHFCECFGEYQDKTPAEEEKKEKKEVDYVDDEEAEKVEHFKDDIVDDQSSSTSTSLLVARLFDADHDCEGNLLQFIVEGCEEAMLLIAPDMAVESLERRVKGRIMRITKGREGCRTDAGKESMLWNPIDEANILLNKQEKAHYEHCRQPFLLGETRAVDHYDLIASNMKGFCHPKCRLIRREILKNKKQVLRNRKRILETQRALRQARRDEEKYHDRNKRYSKLLHESQTQSRTPRNRGLSRTKCPSKKSTDPDRRRSPIRSERQKHQMLDVRSQRLSESPRRVQKVSLTRSPERTSRGYWKLSPDREPSYIHEDHNPSRRFSQNSPRQVKKGKKQNGGIVSDRQEISKSRNIVSQKETPSKRFCTKKRRKEQSNYPNQLRGRFASGHLVHPSVGLRVQLAHLNPILCKAKTSTGIRRNNPRSK